MDNVETDDQILTPTTIQPRRALRGYYWISLLFLGIGIAMLPLDKWLGEPDNLEWLPGDLKRFVSLSEMFAHGFGVGVVAIGVWLLAESKRRLIPRILICAVWPSLGVHLLKLCFARLRPIKYLDESSQANFPANITDTFLGWMPRDELNTIYVYQSFPSAHAATAWGLAIGLSWAFPKGRWLFFFIATLASIQRVTSFAHWTSDVFFGIAIAFFMAGAVTQNWGLGKYLQRFEESDKKPIYLQK